MRFLLFFLLLSSTLTAQVDSTDFNRPDIINDLIEDYLQGLESEGDFNFNEYFDYLEGFRKNPININKASREDLEAFGLLSTVQIDDLMQYRADLGDLIALQELQAIPSFDLLSIRRIQQFVRVSGGLDDYQVPLGKMLTQGDNTMYMRMRRQLEEKRGYIPFEDGGLENGYLGDPFHYYYRFQHQYENRMSYGVTAEKDPGEEFFTGSNKAGFDHYSVHFSLQNYSKRLKTLVLGDYSVNLGQGLIFSNGFGIGKSSDVMNVKKGGYTVRPSRSSNEITFLRGAAVTLGLTDNLELTAFGSYRNKDSNLDAIQLDTLSEELEELGVTGFISGVIGNGTHRTLLEIANKNSLRQITAGGNLNYSTNKGNIGVNIVHHNFDQFFVPRMSSDSIIFSGQDTERIFDFSGDRLTNISLDYSYRWRNLHVFGETAYADDNGSMATINGLLIGLNRRMDMAIVQRHYPVTYHTFDSNPFGESFGGNNEEGLYFGLEIRPASRWNIRASHDIFRNSWLRYRVDAPSGGNESRFRLTYKIRRKMEVYLDLRQENKTRNIILPSDEYINSVKPTQRTNARLHLTYNINKQLELRNRIELSRFIDGEDFTTKGFLAYQDIIFKPNRQLSLTARYALFDADDFDARIYMYENDILYNARSPFYYDRGTRAYINVRFRPRRAWTFEARYAQTYYTNREEIGSSGEFYEGNTQTEVKFQMVWKF